MHRFKILFHCPQGFDLSDKKSLTCETVPLSVKPQMTLITVGTKHRLPESALRF